MSLQKKILITGANGQLGNCFQRLEEDYSLNYEFIFASSTDLDITDEASVESYFENLKKLLFFFKLGFIFFCTEIIL